MKKRIYLGNFTSEIAFYLPYSVGALRAYVEKDPLIREKCEFAPFFFHTLGGVETLLKKMGTPALLGLSTYVWNQERSLKLAYLVKKKFPDCLIVFGGPQVPGNASEWFKRYPFTDILVHNEGEQSFHGILRQLVLESREWNMIPGISYKVGQRIVKNRNTFFMKNLDDCPSPYLMGYFEDNLKEVLELKRNCAAVIETNRGCPYACTFCDWGDDIFDKIRCFPIDKVEKEIEFLGRRISEIYFADANFGMFPRDLDIARRIVEVSKKGCLKTVQVIAAKKKNERTKKISHLLDTHRLSLFGETIGIQTLTPEVSVNTKRRNLSQNKLADLLSDYKNEDINSYIELILGLPGETESSFLETLENILSLKPVDVRTYNLILLPNSHLSSKVEREKWRMKTESVCLIEGREGESEYNEIVTGTKDLSASTLRYLRNLTRFIDIVHGGKWTFYLAWYLKQYHKIPITSFYRDLYRYFKEQRDHHAVLKKVISNWYINTYNSGYFNSFHGPYSPHDVVWDKKFFFKQTFLWLCISEQRDLLYEHIKDYFRFKYEFVPCHIVDDLFCFQSEIMIRNDDFKPRKLVTRYNWMDFFEGTCALKPIHQGLSLKKNVVGRQKTPVSRDNTEWFFEVAGGQYFDKIDRFVHTPKCIN